MADNEFTNFEEATNAESFKEAVCIDAFRVYDSCAEKDCSSGI